MEPMFEPPIYDGSNIGLIYYFYIEPIYDGSNIGLIYYFYMEPMFEPSIYDDSNIGTIYYFIWNRSLHRRYKQARLPRKASLALARVRVKTIKQFHRPHM